MLGDKRKGVLHFRKPRSEEKYVFTGNDTSARVEQIRTFRLLLNTGHFVDLLNTFVVPTLRHNLAYVSTLEKSGYTCTLEIENLVSNMKTILLVLLRYCRTVTCIYLILSLHPT